MALRLLLGLSSVALTLSAPCESLSQQFVLPLDELTDLATEGADVVSFDFHNSTTNRNIVVTASYTSPKPEKLLNMEAYGRNSVLLKFTTGGSAASTALSGGLPSHQASTWPLVCALSLAYLGQQQRNSALVIGSSVALMAQHSFGEDLCQPQMSIKISVPDTHTISSVPNSLSVIVTARTRGPQLDCTCDGCTESAHQKVCNITFAPDDAPKLGAAVVTMHFCNPSTTPKQRCPVSGNPECSTATMQCSGGRCLCESFVAAGGGTTPVAAPTCQPGDAVWNAIAGGFSCGSRITWLQQNGTPDLAKAKVQVAREFPTPCGPCGGTPPPPPPATCNQGDSVWNTQASGYSCGARIEWLVGQGKALTDARNTVAKEFPTQCSSCARDGGGTNTPVPPGFTQCAQENDLCDCRGEMRFGADTRWRVIITNGPTACSTAFFGDPAPGATKSCQCSPSAGGKTGVEVSGRNIFVDGKLLVMKGVCWNPVPKGKRHPPSDADTNTLAASDAPLMHEAGINVLRPYHVMNYNQAMTTFFAKGIRTIVPIDPKSTDDAIKSMVNSMKDHPGLLMWQLGNEWNYNGLYSSTSFDDCISHIARAARAIKDADPKHPVATIYGEVPTPSTLERLSVIDVWGLNVYRFDDFNDLFSVWRSRSTKPMFLGEWGADAWNTITNQVDVAAQAFATTKLSRQIVDNSTPKGGVCSGGAIFEWADEWWKGTTGTESSHDSSGAAPGGGPYPDRSFNEEYWGLVEIDRTKRPAYDAYKNVVFP